MLRVPFHAVSFVIRKTTQPTKTRSSRPKSFLLGEAAHHGIGLKTGLPKQTVESESSSSVVNLLLEGFRADMWQHLL